MNDKIHIAVKEVYELIVPLALCFAEGGEIKDSDINLSIHKLLDLTDINCYPFQSGVEDNVRQELIEMAKEKGREFSPRTNNEEIIHSKKRGST